MAVVNIALTKEQQETIKKVTGLQLDTLAVEKIEGGKAAGKIDLNVSELEDRVNPAIEVPAANTAMPIAPINPGTIYLGVTPTNTVLLQTLTR